jgi:hypothetical protein
VAETKQTIRTVAEFLRIGVIMFALRIDVKKNRVQRTHYYVEMSNYDLYHQDVARRIYGVPECGMQTLTMNLIDSCATSRVSGTW